jgi:hypothetical protein
VYAPEAHESRLFMEHEVGLQEAISALGIDPGRITGKRKLLAGPARLTGAYAIHIAIHNNVAYDVLPMTCSAVRALLCL